MALPKEPRQKMINLMYLVLTALLALNVSSEILNAFKVVDKSLMTSNENLTNANQTLYTSLADKLKDAMTAEKAKPWNEKALEAKKLADEMDAFINQLKVDLKKEAGLTNQKNPETNMMEEKFKEDDLEAATRLFGEGIGGKKQGEVLKSKLIEFREKMLGIDPSIAKEFASTFPVEDLKTAKIVGQDGKPKDFTNAYFHMTPTVAALTLLSKFQNNVKNAENAVVTYCHNQVGAVKVIYDQFTALVGQSSNYLMPGEEIEISAGVGAFSKQAQPQITIGGAGVPLGADGRAVAKFRADGAGAQSKSVSVTYTKPDGTKESKTYEVKYTVGSPGVAAVSPDAMLVFYYGVDNPITIGSPSGWDKTTVSGVGCTLSGSGPSRMVRPAGKTGESKIIVTTDKGTKEFVFRNREIPAPKFKIGSGEGRMLVNDFAAQGYCRADMGPDFFFKNVAYSVQSYTVFFQGPGFKITEQKQVSGNNLGPIKALMDKCLPGCSVSFTNIQVSGPDGTRRLDDVTYALK